MRPRLTDAAEHQNRPNFERMKREDGIHGAIAKMSEGWGYVDPDGETNLRNIVRANLIPGAYHFLWRGPEGKGGRHQAEFFLRQVSKVRNPSKCLLFVDVELSNSMNRQHHPRFEDVKQFLKTIEHKVPGKRVGIYAGYYWRDNMGNPSINKLELKRRPIIWDAHYFHAANAQPASFNNHLDNVPSGYWNHPAFGGRRAQILQFSDRVRFSEYVGDADVADVTLETMKGWVA